MASYSAITGAMDMEKFSVANVAKPVSVRDVVTEGYADNLIGLTYLNMRGNKIVNLREMVQPRDMLTVH